MLDTIKKHLDDKMSIEEKAHLVREDLQIIILKILYDLGMFKRMAFVGGTALRILFDLKRFSEDLDFSITQRKGYSFHKLSQDLQFQLKKYGLDIDVKENDQKIVQSIMLRFKGILPTLGLSPVKSQKVSIRLEIDTNPPAGWKTDISLINKMFVFTVVHYDIPSLYAAKLCACFFRKYVKGRDFYDLVWYLGKKIMPNLELLNNAVRQIDSNSALITEHNFKEYLKTQLAKIDFSSVRKDVERFLVDKGELKLLDKDLIVQLIK